MKTFRIEVTETVKHVALVRAPDELAARRWVNRQVEGDGLSYRFNEERRPGDLGTPELFETQRTPVNSHAVLDSEGRELKQ